jgi:hemerythrin-like domain-containing protein
MSDSPVAARPGGLSRNPLDVIARCYQAQAAMCDELERVADGLLDQVDRQQCARLASWLQFDLALHHHDEEEALFPLLRRRARPEDRLEPILERLLSEHSVDMDLAADIAEELAGLAQGNRPSNPEMLGYMLRGFFEAYRRHVLWENTLLMPLAHQRLTSEDLDLLQLRMDEIRNQAV